MECPRASIAEIRREGIDGRHSVKTLQHLAGIGFARHIEDEIRQCRRQRIVHLIMVFRHAIPIPHAQGHDRTLVVIGHLRKGLAVVEQHRAEQPVTLAGKGAPAHFCSDLVPAPHALKVFRPSDPVHQIRRQHHGGQDKPAHDVQQEGQGHDPAPTGLGQPGHDKDCRRDIGCGSPISMGPGNEGLDADDQERRQNKAQKEGHCARPLGIC